MTLLMHCEFAGYYGSLTSLTRWIATWNIPLTGYYKRLPLGAVLTNCIADHGKDGKNVKSDCLIVWQQSHNQLGYLLISYHYSASLVHGPLVNPLQYHIIGTGAGGGGAGGGQGRLQLLRAKMRGKLSPSPLPSQKFMYVSKRSDLPPPHVQFKMPSPPF